METPLNTRKMKLLLTTALALAGVAAIAPRAEASGFGLREGAADWMGNAFAGESAKAYDPSPPTLEISHPPPARATAP